jgi:16S rRNA (cytidine1402-2'-O)-methyltransferase
MDEDSHRQNHQAATNDSKDRQLEPKRDVLSTSRGGIKHSALTTLARGQIANLFARLRLGTQSMSVRWYAMLYVIATPIGNLGDITLRALEVLKSADVIAAEDTRHSGILLKHYQISKPFVSYHEHNEAMRTAQLIERMAAGENVALITDAGMPGLSDPGARLIRECIKRELPFTIIPGPSSILTALVGSGFTMENFCFRGFLPVKSGRRERELRAATNRDETTIFFESPYRLAKTLRVCVDIMPNRLLCVARELTKKFEEFRRGNAAELLAHYEARPPKGEIVLLISDKA